MTRRLLSTQKIVNLSSDPATGVSGEIYFNTTSNSFRWHNGTVWGDLSSGGGGGGGGLTISDTAPTYSAGSMWFNSSNGKTYVAYDYVWVEIGGNSSTGIVSTDVALSNSWWLGV